MRFDLITIFPQFFAGPLDYGIVRRAKETGLIEANVHDLRAFAHDRHRTTDDRPFGGGEGMVMKPEPLFEAVESLLGPVDARGAGGSADPGRAAIVLLSASGKPLRQETARRFASLDRLVLLCGRYEGVDERVAQHLATDEISVGDFVLSGGELPSMMILDAVTRLLPGALGNEDSTVNESFSEIEGPSLGPAIEPSWPQPPNRAADRRSPAPRALLDYPHYTRPQSFRGWEVPSVLMSGNHEEIRRWRRQMAIEKTLRNRPDLVAARTIAE